VPEMIANFFQRKPFRHQAAGTGMAQRVRSAAWDPDSECTQTCADQMIERPLRESSKRRLQRQKDLPPRTAGPYLLEVSENGLADLDYQRVLLGAPPLGTRDRNNFTFPVHIFQT